MNNEQPNNTDRFTLVEEKNGSFVINDNEVPDDWNEVCFFYSYHPYARKAAECARDMLTALVREGENIRPVEYVTTPRRLPIVEGQFSKAAPLTLTVEEKRRYLAQIFRSPNSSDSDKFKALQEDNRMQAMFSLKNETEQPLN